MILGKKLKGFSSEDVPETALKTTGGKGRWALLLGLPGCGKSTLLKELYEKCNNLLEPIYATNAYHFRRDKSKGKAMVIVEDLPVIANNNPKLKEFLSWLSIARHYTNHVLVSTQSLSLFDEWVFDQFRLLVLFQNDLNPDLREKYRIPERIIELAERLPRYKYFLYDKETRKYSEVYENKNYKPLLKALKQPIV